MHRIPCLFYMQDAALHMPVYEKYIHTYVQTYIRTDIHTSYKNTVLHLALSCCLLAS